MKRLFLAGIMIGSALLLVSVTPSVVAVAEISPTPTPTTRVQNRQNTVTTVKSTALTRAKVIAEKILKLQYINKLEGVKTRVQNNERLGSEAKSALQKRLETELAWFSAQREKIASAVTIEQVRTYTREARLRFTEVAREVRRLHVAGGYVTSLEKITENLEKKIIPRLEAKITELESKTIDVTVEKEALVHAKSDVATAKSKITEIRNSSTIELAKSNFDSAKASIKSAREYLKQVVEGLSTKL